MNDTFCGFQFKKMVLSSILMMIAFSLSGIADFVLAAQFFGDNAMAAVNLVTPIFFVVTFLSSLIGTGTAYLYSFEIGAFRHEKANKLIGQGAILAVTSSILLATVLFFGQDAFFSLFNVTGELETFAHEYYSVFLLSIAINPIHFLMYVIVYADGGGKNGVIATFLNLLVNFVASIVLGMKLGMSGIAFGTLLGYLASILVFAKWIFVDSRTLRPILYISLSETVRVIKYSFVHASLYLYIGLGNIILNAFFLKTFGEENFPILSVVLSILQLAVFLDGVAEAAEPPINVYLGEKNLDGVQKVMKIAIKAAF
ncbi:MAG: multi antimicrobial extrusion protein, partial [Selenomonadaceae bacterium]|nr:multi antimicrobial extrusion protein [Selenomonadaceae bacterium]